MAAVDRILMTPMGHRKLLDEIQRLAEERVEIVKAIERAREFGDLSENADYDEAKKAQGLNASRAGVLQELIGKVFVVEKPIISQGKIVFGATVYLNNLAVDQEVKYTIVSAYESSVDDGLLSVESPLARELLGKSVGHVVALRLPKGLREYQILKVTLEGPYTENN